MCSRQPGVLWAPDPQTGSGRAGVQVAARVPTQSTAENPDGVTPGHLQAGQVRLTLWTSRERVEGTGKPLPKSPGSVVTGAQQLCVNVGAGKSPSAHNSVPTTPGQVASPPPGTLALAWDPLNPSLVALYRLRSHLSRATSPHCAAATGLVPPV